MRVDCIFRSGFEYVVSLPTSLLWPRNVLAKQAYVSKVFCMNITIYGYQSSRVKSVYLSINM